jgi:HAD superfamily hydrolase (TIGR01509 family)
MPRRPGIVLDGFDTTICCPWTQIRGQLADFIGISLTTLNDAYRATQEARNIGVFSSQNDEMLAILNELGMDPKMATPLVELNESAIRQKTSLYMDVVAFLKACSESGVSTSILSNCGPLASAAFTSQNIYSLVDRVHLSFEIGFRKPDRRSYEYARQAMGRNGHLIFIDDNPSFCLGARSAGYEAIQISRSEKAEHHQLVAGIRQASSLTNVAEWLFS